MFCTFVVGRLFWLIHFLAFWISLSTPGLELYNISDILMRWKHRVSLRLIIRKTSCKAAEGHVALLRSWCDFVAPHSGEQADLAHVGENREVKLLRGDLSEM